MTLHIDEHVKIEQMHVMPWWLSALLLIEGVGIVVIALTACWNEVALKTLCVLLSTLLLMFMITAIVSRKYIAFASDVYSEFLKWQKATTEGETQNSKLSETLLKIWEHREDCKGASLKATIEVSQTGLSC